MDEIYERLDSIINREPNVTLAVFNESGDIVYTEKMTAEQYHKRNFKKKYNFVPDKDDGTKGMSKEEIQLSLKTFCKLCKTYYGHSPIIYCSESYFKDYLSPEFDGYYLWIASYNHEPVLPGEPHYDIWQFSRHGRVPGVWNWVDLNRFADGRTLDDIRIKE